MNKDELQLILEEGEGYRIEFKESKAGLPPIKFEFDNFFTASFKRLKTVEKTREKILKAIKDNPKITQNVLAKLLVLQEEELSGIWLS
jgi:predicted HTH transcriptional regulator